jgi:colanic acid/amylovoran biosynthesis protein
MKVLITNQYSANMGDRAMLFFMLDQLSKNGFKKVTVSTHNPYYWRDFKGFNDLNVRFIPFGWSVCGRNPKPIGIMGRILLIMKDVLYKNVFVPIVRKALKEGKCPSYIKYFCTKEYWDAVAEADIVLGMGGHRITTLLVKDVMISATFDMAIVLLQKKPLALWSQTIGPLNFKNEENKKLIQKILTEAKCIYIRDEGSKKELENLNIPLTNVFETRDSVFGMDKIVSDLKKPSEREKVLGMAIYIKKRSLKQKEEYMSCLAEIADYAAEKGYSVLFFPMGIDGLREMPCIHGIIKRAKNKINILKGCTEIPEMMNKVAQCRLFIGHKTHSVIFSLITATPLVAIAYQRKTSDFMNQFGLSEYCIDDKLLKIEKLKTLFSQVESHIDDIHKKEVAWINNEAERVREDFSKMMKYVGGYAKNN